MNFAAGINGDPLAEGHAIGCTQKLGPLLGTGGVIFCHIGPGRAGFGLAIEISTGISRNITAAACVDRYSIAPCLGPSNPEYPYDGPQRLDSDLSNLV